MSVDTLIDVTLEYGKGYYDLTERKYHKENIIVNEKGIEKEITKKYLLETDNLCKIYDIYPTYKIKLLDYHIHKIIYSFNSNQNIQSFKIIYRNRNNGQEMVLDSENSHLIEEKTEEFVLQDMEEIIDVYFHFDNKENLTSICLTTNLGNIKYIGKQSDNYIKDKKLNSKGKVILSFGMSSTKMYVVTSKFCYYIDKKNMELYKILD